ncbi:hypothetical protein RF11_01539 [Thelohanellus kitauei]|uniref:Uncharacterized protein n=1 Tax=Thelohanellus kitauei TaxID=669202 RepID=A0A0C2IU90_THEKT|nr:hypothetical protein RF11_01539 [Thelohanellus kitauei]
MRVEFKLPCKYSEKIYGVVTMVDQLPFTQEDDLLIQLLQDNSFGYTLDPCDTIIVFKGHSYMSCLWRPSKDDDEKISVDIEVRICRLVKTYFNYFGRLTSLPYMVLMAHEASKENIEKSFAQYSKGKYSYKVSTFEDAITFDHMCKFAEKFAIEGPNFTDETRTKIFYMILNLLTNVDPVLNDEKVTIFGREVKRLEKTFPYYL